MAHNPSRKPHPRRRAIVKLIGLLALIGGGKYFLPENPLVLIPPTTSPPIAVAVPAAALIPSPQPANQRSHKHATDQTVLLVSWAERQAQH